MNRNTIIGIVSVNLLFWALALLVGLVGNWEFIPFKSADGTYQPVLLCGTFFNAIVFYANSLWFYPRFKNKTLKLPYWLCILLLIGISAGLEAWIDFQFAKRMNLIPVLEEQFAEGGIPLSAEWAMLDWILQQIFTHGFYFLLSFALIFLINNIRQEDIHNALEKERLNTELKYLKAQLNPHFLFNGINSVYHLIDQKPTIAKDTLLKFSNLLRYQLYECNDDIIPLEKELDHIRDYVEMEKIRKGEDAMIELTLPDETNLINIPPLLFTPFIENSFKYVSNYDDGTKNKINIQIRLQTEAGKLRFEAMNTIDEYTIKKGGGIGIENVKKRLALLFPNRHDIDIIKEEDRYIVRMNLTLKNA